MPSIASLCTLAVDSGRARPLLPLQHFDLSAFREGLFQE